MPTYEYECQNCHLRIEAVQAFSDAPLSECANCGGALRKVFSGVGIVFKGSGFYKTDSRGSSSAATPPATSTPATTTATATAAPSSSTSSTTASTSASD